MSEPKMIELTDAGHEDKKHLINLVHVESIVSKHNCTRIYFHSSQGYLEVKETPAEIMDKINHGDYTAV